MLMLKCSLPQKLQAKNGVETVRKNLDCVNIKKTGFMLYCEKTSSPHICKKNRLPAIFAKNLPKVHFATVHPSTKATTRMKYLHALDMMRRAQKFK